MTSVQVEKATGVSPVVDRDFGAPSANGNPKDDTNPWRSDPRPKVRAARYVARTFALVGQPDEHDGEVQS